MNVGLSSRAAVVGALALAAVVGVTVFFATRSSAVQPLGPRAVAVRGSSLRVPDPIGRYDWRFATAKAPAPLICVRALYVNRHRTRSISAGTCGKNRRGLLITAADVEHPSPETLVFGYMPTSIKRLTITGPGGARTFDFTPRGRIFGAAFAGRVPVRDLAAVATTKSGDHRTLNLGGAERASAPDPAGGTPWLADAFSSEGGPRVGQTCVHVLREQPRFGARIDPGTTRPLCSDLTGTSHFFTVRRIGNRVVVFGVATKRIRQVVIEGGGRRQRPRIAPHGRAFVAVFDRARTSSDGIKVTVVPLEGQPAVYVGQRNVNVSTLRTNWWQGLPPRGALSGTVQVIPPSGGPSTPIDVWFRPTVALDSPLDRYVLQVQGPGGTECRGQMHWRIGGFSWSSQYNKRNARQGISLRLLPHRTPYGLGGNPPRETWCAGTYRGRVLLLDAAPHGHRVHQRSLQRFTFTIGGNAMRYRYHGRLISPDSAARHHLKCIQDFGICDDSNQKVLRDALRLGLPVSGGKVTVP